jgi:hypothetical protein
MVENSVVSRIFAVFTEIIDWFTTSISSVSEMFYNDTTGLTLFGTLAIIGLGISVVFLLVNVIKSMLRLR